jgi:competence protein ComEC
MEEYLREPGRPQPTRPPDTREADAMRLHVIDVGQGLSALLEFPCAAVLFDTGGESNDRFDSQAALLAYLDRFFDRRRDLDRTLALLVISHPHIDHTRGIEAVLAHYRVRNVLDNGDVREDIGGRPQIALHSWLSRHREVHHLDLARSDIDDREGLTSPVIDPVRGCKASRVDPVIRALWSGDLGREELGHNPNNDRVMLRVDFGRGSALLPGDVELLAIARLLARYQASPALLDTDVFVVPHHGSKNSNTRELVRRVTPKVAVISAGPYDRTLAAGEFTARAFGHPHEISINFLLDPVSGVSMRRPHPVQVWVGQRGAWRDRPSEFTRTTIDRAIYSTGWDGTVVVTIYASGWIQVATER